MSSPEQFTNKCRYIKIDGYLEVPADITVNMLCLDLIPALKGIGVSNFEGVLYNRADCARQDEENHVTIQKI
jgi:hypothetical protein